MSNIKTIEQDFEYQMQSVLVQFAKDWDLSPKNGEELFDELRTRRKAFADIVINQMLEYMEEDDWLVQIQEY